MRSIVTVEMAMAIQVQASIALLGSENYVLALGLSTAIGTMISMALTPTLIKKLGEKTTFIALSVYGFVVSLLAFLIYAFVTDNMVVMLVFLFLTGLKYKQAHPLLFPPLWYIIFPVFSEETFFNRSFNSCLIHPVSSNLSCH